MSDDALSRLRAMIAPDQQTWDLSPNDVAALTWAVNRIEAAKQAANSKKGLNELTRLASPLIDHIRLNHDPHTRILVDWSSAEVIQSTCRVIAPE